MNSVCCQSQASQVVQGAFMLLSKSKQEVPARLLTAKQPDLRLDVDKFNVPSSTNT